jgi:hypothetical protein
MICDSPGGFYQDPDSGGFVAERMVQTRDSRNSSPTQVNLQVSVHMVGV